MDIKELAAVLEKYPEVTAHLKKMLGIIEGPNQGKFSTADAIEEQTIEAVRGIGRETIRSWAEQQSLMTSNQVKAQVSSAKKNVKKKSAGRQRLGQLK